MSTITFLSFTSIFYNVKVVGWKEILGVFTIFFDILFDGNRLNIISSFLLGVSMAAYPVTVVFCALWLV